MQALHHGPPVSTEMYAAWTGLLYSSFDKSSHCGITKQPTANGRPSWISCICRCLTIQRAALTPNAPEEEECTTRWTTHQENSDPWPTAACLEQKVILYSSEPSLCISHGHELTAKSWGNPICTNCFKMAKGRLITEFSPSFLIIEFPDLLTHQLHSPEVETI